MKKRRFLNVVDSRQNLGNTGFPEKYETILFNEGSLKSHGNGFIYNFQYKTERGVMLTGVGIIVNPGYIGKSEEEICLLCDIANPVSKKDIKNFCLANIEADIEDLKKVSENS